MNAIERPEIKVEIQKKGIWKFIPYGFDLFSQKFLISLENNSNQDVKERNFLVENGKWRL